MEYWHNKSKAIFGGLVTGFIGLMALIICFSCPELISKIILGVSGSISIFISLIFFTYNAVVKIDVRAKRIEKTIGFLFWSKSKFYNFSDFREVGISFGWASADTDKSDYFILLIGVKGVKNVVIPGVCCVYEVIKKRGETVAAEMNLPFNPKPPKISFYGGGL